VKEFLRKYLFATLLAIGIIAILIILVADKYFENPTMIAIMHSISTGLIASLIFAAILRYLIETDMDDVMVARIDEALKSNIEKVATTVSEKTNLRINSIQNFMPEEPIVNRTNAFDLAEVRVRELLVDCVTYESFGITAKYASHRLAELLEQNALKRQIEARVFVAHPFWLRGDLIRNHEKKRLELIGSLAALSELPEWLDTTVYFTSPVPAFRVDRMDNSAIVFMYSDDQRGSGALPDAGLYAGENYWFRSIQSFLSDERKKAMCSWKVHGGLFDHKPFSSNVNRIVEGATFSQLCGHLEISEDDQTAGVKMYCDFKSDMESKTRNTP
jgi:hypothetical protein